MWAMYLTPASIGYLSQFILALAIAGFLLYWTLFRARLKRPVHTASWPLSLLPWPA